jgi:hypothetical protein
MKSIHPFVALAGAAVVFATGYAWGAASDSAADPFMNTKVLATSGVSFVDGPEADPPPWPADAPQTAKAAIDQPAAVTTAAAQRPAPFTPPAAPPETERVVPGTQASGALGGDNASLAMSDIPSSAIAPVYHPPEAPAESSALVPDDTRRVTRRLRAHSDVQKQITFGTKRSGQPVTIIWDTR